MRRDLLLVMCVLGAIASVGVLLMGAKPTTAPIRAVFHDGLDFVSAPTQVADCATAGTDNTGALSAGRYEVCAFDEDVYLSSSSPASSSGYRLSAGTCRDFRLYASTTIYCYSAGGTADVQVAAY